MKKIFAFLLVAVMLFAVMAVTVNAEPANENITVEYVKKAPKIDGKVDRNEYNKAIVTYHVGDDYDGVILANNEYDDWGFTFYSAWDDDNLYLAWVVDSEVQSGIPAEVRDDPSQGLGYMWEHSCVQFILTGGAPNKDVVRYQTSQWSGEYLESGVTLASDGSPEKINWSIFSGSGTLRHDLRVAEKAVNAGCDILLIPTDLNGPEAAQYYDEYIAGIAGLVDEGVIPMERVDESVRRILTLKARRGILDMDVSGADVEERAATASRIW